MNMEMREYRRMRIAISKQRRETELAIHKIAKRSKNIECYFYHYGSLLKTYIVIIKESKVSKELEEFVKTLIDSKYTDTYEKETSYYNYNPLVDEFNEERLNIEINITKRG